MTPVVKLYWFITLIVTPVSLWWLLYATNYSLSFAAVAEHPVRLTMFLGCVAWVVQGGYERFFCISNLRRNYPVLANIRYLLEYIRPEIQQYFIANNVEEKPFSRERRNMIYRRAKGANDTLPFGTEQEILAAGYRSLLHSLNATHVAEEHRRITIGNDQCRQPYSASRLNISAMSFGALSARAIEALNRGAKLGDFAHNTGEGGLSPHHLKHGGDIIWQIGTGYFSCRQPDGRFDNAAFQERATQEAVKMIEIKLSQGAKPSHGGVLPGAKVTREIADIRLVTVGETVFSPPTHPEFSTPQGLLEFVQRLRELSGGKPVGFKLCLGRKAEFLGIIKAMLELNIVPDFITIDGAEGGTGAAPVEFSNRLGTPCLEGTYYVHQVLIGAGLRDRVRLINAGQTASGFDMLEKMLVGADAVNAARAMMMALGCIQAKSCNTNHCPTGVATQDPFRATAINVREKSERVRNFHHATVEACFELFGAMGYDDPSKAVPADLYRRGESGLKNYDQIYHPLLEGQLLSDSIPEAYRDDWHRASARHFSG